VLERAIKKPRIGSRLLALFNDADQEYIDCLKEKAEELEGFNRLRIRPEFSCETVGEHIAEEFEKVNLIPTLLFVDPWGYKGLSLRLINSVLKHDKSEVIFFFNYRRINAAVDNPMMVRNINRLFEKERANSDNATPASSIASIAVSPKAERSGNSGQVAI